MACSPGICTSSLVTYVRWAFDFGLEAERDGSPMRVPSSASGATRQKRVDHGGSKPMVLGPLGDRQAGSLEPCPCLFDRSHSWHAAIP